MLTRKFLVAMALATLVVALSASPAVAFDRHFRVLASPHSYQTLSPDRFRLKAGLFDPRHPHDRVGHSGLKCRLIPNGVRCRIVVHFNGRIGGRGDIKMRGDIKAPKERRLNVVGGTADFNGVAGKVLVHPSAWHFDLTR